MQLNERKIFTVPNQKVIEISPGNGREEGETYGIITRREEMTAAKLLNDKSASLMLYYHFALNQDGYEFALSPTEIQEKLGIIGNNERKALSMSITDRALRAKELDEPVVGPAQNPEFVLLHGDNVDASGFVQHIKLPHYVDFQADLSLISTIP